MIGVVLTIVTALTDGAVAVQVYPVLCPFLLLLRLLSLLLALLLFLLFLLSLPFHFVDHAPLFPLPFFSIRRPAASLHSGRWYQLLAPCRRLPSSPSKRNR